MKRHEKIAIAGGVAVVCLGLSASIAASTLLPGVQQGLRQRAGAEAQEAAVERIVSAQGDLSSEQRVAQAKKADGKAGAGKVFEQKKVVLTFADGVGEDEALELVRNSPVIDGGKICSQSFGAPVVAVEAQVAPEFTVAQAQEVLKSDARVRGAQPNFYYTLAGESSRARPGAARGSKVQSTATDDPYRSKQDFLNQVGVYEAWDYVKTDNKVTVAVIDTGIDMDHPDLEDNIVGPYDVVGDDKGDDTPSVPDDSPDDVLGHGTHCAGLAAGVTNNDRGIASVSYNANVMPIKVFYYSESAAAQGAAEPYVSSSVDIMAAYNYLMENASTYNVHVASMSLGGAAVYDDTPEAEQQKREDDLCIEAVQKAYDDYDVVTVAAAGNEHTDAAQWPADSAPCIGVIALNESGTGRDTSYSNYGPTKKISAPGTDIFSTCWDGDATGSVDAAYSDAENGSYGTMTGTSMATPIVAGATALLFAADDTMTAARAEEILCNTATDLGAKGRDDQTGYGALDVARMAKSVARADVASIDGLPTSAVVGQPVELSGTVAAAETANGAQVRSTKVDFELLDAGETGASLSGATFRAGSTGTATIRATVKEGGAFCSDYTQDFQVNVVEGSLSDHGAISGLQDSYAYTGGAIEPKPTVAIDGGTLVEGRDYELSYADNTACGTATVTATGLGAVSGSVSASFTIVPRSLSGASVSGVSQQYYTGGAVTPRPTVAVGGRTLAEGVDYTVSYGSNVGPGTGTLTITGIGGYTGTRSVSFGIVRQSVASARVTVRGPFRYTGGAVEPVPVVELGGRRLEAGTDFIASYNDNRDAGTAELDVIGIGRYEGNASVRFEIGRADIADATIAAIPAQSWSGKEVRPAPELEMNGSKLVAGTDYRVSYRDNVELGTATLTVTGIGNFSGSSTASFKIGRASLADAKVAVVGDWTYDGTAKEPAPRVVVAGRTLVAGTDYTTSYRDNVDAGTAEVTVSGTGAYEGSASASFPIGRADLSGAAVAPVPEQDWTGGKVKPAPKLRVGDKELVAGSDYRVAYRDNVGPGTARLEVSGTGNYEGSLMLEFRIAKHPKAGMAVTWKGASYRLVRGASGRLVASFEKLRGKKAKKATIPAKVKVLGSRFEVASVSKRAFYGCKKLRTLTVKARGISRAGSKAFGKTSAKLEVRVPAGKAGTYRKLFVKAGLSKKAKVR